MATNTLLTINKITQEAQRVLHEKLNFISNINTQYDGQFAVQGAKIGDSIRIRLPARFTTRKDSSTFTATNYVEQSSTLQLNHKYGIDLNFTADDLALSMDDFSSRVIEPAMAQLAADVEAVVLADAIVTGGAIYTSGTGGSTYLDWAKAGALLDYRAAPKGNGRSALLDPMGQATIVDSLKGSLQPSAEISKQYLEGAMGRAAGFDWYSNTKLPTIAIGADVAGATTSAVTVDGATSLVCDSFANAQVIKKGTAITVADCYDVNYETKGTLGFLKSFIVTADVTCTTAGVATLSVLPIYFTNKGRQNVSAFPGSGKVVTILGEANTVQQVKLAFAKDFMVFATADLILPKGVEAASRSNYEGISVRMVKVYNQADDSVDTRFDILFGSKVIRPELAVSVLSR